MEADKGVVEGYLTKEEEEYFSSGGSKEPENLEHEVQDAEQSQSSEGDAGSDSSTNDGTENVEEDSTDSSDDESVEGTTSSDDDGIESENESQPSPKKRDLEKAFKTERHKRKEMREKLEANETRTRELENKLAQLQEQLTKTSQQPAPIEPPENIPDPEEDPLGYQQYKINKLEQSIKSQSEYLRQQHEYSQRTQQEQAFRAHYENQAREYAQKQPDFMDAYNYLMGARIEEHLAAGFNEKQAQQLVIEDEIAIASLAFKDRVNPAERIYSIAKARGYVPGNKPKQSKSPSIESIKKGMDNAKSLKSGGGELPNRMQGMDEIDGMSFDEFDKFWAGYRNKAKASR